MNNVVPFRSTKGLRCFHVSMRLRTDNIRSQPQQFTSYRKSAMEALTDAIQSVRAKSPADFQLLEMLEEVSPNAFTIVYSDVTRELKEEGTPDPEPAKEKTLNYNLYDDAREGDSEWDNWDWIGGKNLKQAVIEKVEEAIGRDKDSPICVIGYQVKEDKKDG